MNNAGNKSFLPENETKALARIDEILARSRKVVEESMELSKKNIEQKIKTEPTLDIQSTDYSLLGRKRSNSKAALKVPETPSQDSFVSDSQEKALEEVHHKIRVLQTKAEEDEKTLQSLRQKTRNFQGSENNLQEKIKEEILNAEKLIYNLKETLNSSLAEENKKLKENLEALSLRKQVEEMKLSQELEELINERKNLEGQLNNLRYLQEHSPNYKQELDEAKAMLREMEKQTQSTIKVLETKIQDQSFENRKLKEMLQDPNEKQRLKVIKVKFEDQAKQNISLVKRLKNQ